jgi:hypothetical protein
MCSEGTRSVRSRCLASVFIALLAGIFASPALADALVTSESTVYGKVLAVRASGVDFAPACGPAHSVFPRDQVRQIEFNGSCKPAPIRPMSGGVGLCDNAQSLFETQLSDGTKLDAADVQVDQGRVHIRSADGLTQWHGDRSRVRTIVRRLVCRDAVVQAGDLKGFCREQVQFAVNFGPEPVFGNRILTRGLSFFLEDEAGKPVSVDNPVGAVIREAFGTAMTEWMGALQDRSAALPPEGRTALAGMISTSSGGYRLLTPPQVVQVGCPDTASFIIRYAFRNPSILIVDGDTKAARAEVKGRTIWINGASYGCWRATARTEIHLNETAGSDPAGHCYNLVPILAHELGHAFGLTGHRDLSSVASIMDSQIREAALRPTPADADDLIKVLLSPIAGAPAGRLDADGLGVDLAR